MQKQEGQFRTLHLLPGGIGIPIEAPFADSKALNFVSCSWRHTQAKFAKPEIERDWFNPGIFVLSGDMYNVSSQKNSPNESYSGFNQKRFSDMYKYIFPAYPTAFVVARDVTVKLTTSQTISDATSAAMEEHASGGGGFLFFSARKSSSSSSSSTHVQSSGKSVTIRFTNPQVLGYYMEATAPDQSTYIDNNTSADSRISYVTIMEFVEKCQVAQVGNTNFRINYIVGKTSDGKRTAVIRVDIIKLLSESSVEGSPLESKVVAQMLIGIDNCGELYNVYSKLVDSTLE